MIMDPRMEPYSAAGSRSSTGLKQRDSWRSDHCSEAGTKTCFCCGEKVEVRLFERRDVSYRVYALCVMCGWWFEL